MGKGSYFSTKNTGKYLLFITDLRGEVVHISGNPALVKSTYRKMFRKNFFQDLITEKSKQEIMKDCANLRISMNMSEHASKVEVMPHELNKKSFLCSFRTVPKQKSKGEVEYKVKCFRMLAGFRKGLPKDYQSQVMTCLNFNLIREHCTAEYIEEVILIQVKSSKSSTQMQKQQVSEQSVINYETPLYEGYSEMIKNEQNQSDLIYQTPVKNKKQADHSSTKHPRKIEPKEQKMSQKQQK